MAPFMRKDENGVSKVNAIRIVEAIISSIVVATITSAVLLYSSHRVMGEKVEEIKCDVNEMKMNVKEAIGNHELRLRTIEIKFAAAHGTEFKKKKL